MPTACCERWTGSVMAMQDGCWHGRDWIEQRSCYRVVTTAAAVYWFKLCCAMLEGFVAEMPETGALGCTHRNGDASRPWCRQVLDALDRAVDSIMRSVASRAFHDATAGQLPKEGLVQLACALEM